MARVLQWNGAIAVDVVEDQAHPSVRRVSSGSACHGGICAVCASCGLEKIELICRRLARHGPLPGSRREDPMLRPNPPIAMGVGIGRRVLQQCHQDAKRSGIDMWGRAMRHAVQTAIKHPGRNFQPPIGGVAGETAAENLPVGLLDHLMNVNTTPGPRMPRITCVPRSCGCSFVVLFNTVRPHSSLAI